MTMVKIGRYQVVAELGKGAMGVVYRATDPNIGRDVAVKTLRLDLHGADADEVLRRFKNEARAAGVMNHPNIVTIYDAGEQDGIFYIAMEYVDGKTLQDVLRHTKVPPVEMVVEIVRQVCAGLDYAHARGIIHRDIKPANIMIRPDGSVKIMDFGIAKLGTSSMTSTGQVVGTPNYVAPEQVKGKRVDGRADLFSVGVILYEMLTGERPFTGESITTVIYKIVNENPPRPRDLDASVHPGLSAAVMKALSKAPEERYAKGAELMRDLENYRSYSTQVFAVPAAAATVAALTAASAAEEASAATAPAISATAGALWTAGALGDETAAAKPAPVPAAPSTRPAGSVAAAPRPVSSPSKAPPLIALAAVVVLIAGGLYVRSHRTARPAQAPPAQAASAPDAGLPPTASEAKPAEETSPAPAEESAPAEPAAREAAKQEKPAPVFGELQIASTPPGASVTIDGHGNKKWITPFAAARLKPGRHSVNFALDGYQPETRQVEVTAGKKLPVEAALQSSKATVSVSSDPAGGEILVDGHDTGQLTPSRVTVAPGKHRVTVRKQGFTPQTKEASVAAGEVLDFATTLAAVPPQPPAPPEQPAPAAQDAQQQKSGNPFRKIGRFFKGSGDGGVLEVRTIPKGAEVWVGDKKAPSKTPAKVEMQPGTYAVTLKMKGYKPVERSVTIEKGKTMGIEETLVKE